MHPSSCPPPRYRFLGSTPAVLIAVVLCSGPAPGAPPAESRVQAPYGFRAEDLIHFQTNQFLGGLLVLPGEELAVFDGVSVVLYRPNGGGGLAEPAVLFTPEDPPFFGAFLRLASGGTAIYFGGTRTGDKPHSIYRIPVSPGDPAGVTEVDRLRFNYDLAVDGQGRAFVSSLEIVSENRIFLLDGDPAAPSDPVVVNIPGYSGPVAFHDDKLYYATAIPEAGVNTVVYFTAAQLEEGIGEGRELDFQQELAENRLAVVATGVNTFFNFAFAGEWLLVSDPFGGGLLRILPDGTLEQFASAPLDTGSSGSIGFLAFRPGSRDFLPGSGPEGGTLYLTVSDFTAFNDAVKITPELFFRRGYVNTDPSLDLTDAVDLLGYLFLEGEPPDSPGSGDVNDDGVLDLSDPIYLLAFLFTGGPQPPEPFSAPGPDPTP